MPPTTAKRRCSMAPAATLATVGVRWAARCRGRTTPVTPAHSALRSRAPRFRGSVIPAATRRNGGRPAVRPARQVLERHRLERGGLGHHALGASVRLGVKPGPGHQLDPDVAPGGQGLDVVELGRGVLSLGDEEPAHGPAPGGQQLEDGPAPLDLVPAQLAPGPAPDGRHRSPVAGRPARPGAAGPPGRRHPVAAGRHHRASSTRTTARQAIPSARPSAPRPSAGVALTDTGADRTRPVRPWPRRAGPAAASRPRRCSRR